MNDSEDTIRGDEDAMARRDELVALQSIYGCDGGGAVCVNVLDDTQLTIDIECDRLDTPVTVRASDDGVTYSSTITYTPPLRLHITLPPTYPSRAPPMCRLTHVDGAPPAHWLEERARTRLLDDLRALYTPVEPVIYTWIAHVTDDALRVRRTDNNNDDNDTGAILPTLIDCDLLVPNSHEDNDTIMHQIDTNCTPMSLYRYLNNANERRCERAFDDGQYECTVCCRDDIIGTDCTQFQPCAHVFCVDCVREYFTMHIRDGTLTLLRCLKETCKSTPTEAQLRRVLNDSALFYRYEQLTLERGLDQMHDVARCPRCSQPVIVELPSSPIDKRELAKATASAALSGQPAISTDDNDDASNERTRPHVLFTPTVATCVHCSYTFCTYCRRVNHGVASCSFSVADRQKIYDEYTRGTTDERTAMEQRYGKHTLQRLLQDIEAMQWINENSKPCPHCHMHIEKNDGCNKMHCTHCGSAFCWLCARRINTKNPYDHFNDPSNKTCFNQLFAGVVMDDGDINFFDE